MNALRRALCAALFLPTISFAEAEIDPHLSVELNAAQTVEGSCLFSFLVVNNHEHSMEKVVFEAVLFDQNNQVSRLLLFDFGALPTKRPRVRQFSVPGLGCEGLKQVLLNGVAQCDGKNLPEDACQKDLQLNTRINIEIIG